jgi:hypothetical protein
MFVSYLRANNFFRIECEQKLDESHDVMKKRTLSRLPASRSGRSPYARHSRTDRPQQQHNPQDDQNHRDDVLNQTLHGEAPSLNNGPCGQPIR